jgi:hypothetical protein
MKYHEIVLTPDRRRRDNIARNRHQISFNKVDQKFGEGSINRLYNDLMDALEGRLMSVEPVATRDKH